MISLISKSTSGSRPLSFLSPRPPPPSFFLPTSRRCYAAPPKPTKAKAKVYTPKSVPPKRSPPPSTLGPPSSSSSTSSSSSSSASSVSPPRGSFLPSPSQIQVVPFSHSPSQARAYLDERAPIHVTFLYLLQKLRKLFKMKIHTKLVGFEAVYLPCWNVKAEVKVPFISRFDTSSRNLRVFTEDGFFPGTPLTPFKWISCRPSLSTLPTTKPFLPSILTQFDRKIRALPFQLSPLVLPQLTKQLPHLNVGEHVVVDAAKAIEWKHLSAVPLYLPFYVASYEHRLVKFKLLLEDTQEDLNDCYYNVSYAHPSPLNKPSLLSSLKNPNQIRPTPTRFLLSRWSFSQSKTHHQPGNDPKGFQQPLFELCSTVAEPLEYRKDLAKGIAEKGSRRFEQWLDGDGIYSGLGGLEGLEGEAWLERVREREGEEAGGKNFETIRELSEKGEGEEGGFVGKIGRG